MPGFYYCDEYLSGEESSGRSSSSEDEDEDEGHEIKQCSSVALNSLASDSTKNRAEHPKKDPLLPELLSNRRVIVHVDVDCFYCQCEHLEKKIPFDKPLGIGQKHILVTCNYAARAYGVTKLQLREEAIKLCPSLMIVEGSDLERYRVRAREIYLSFREACKDLVAVDAAVCKGSMDEMVADLSVGVDEHRPSALIWDSCLSSVSSSQTEDTIYVHGEKNLEKTVLTEDQSGATTLFVNKSLEQGKLGQQQEQVTIQRFRQAGRMALAIRQAIFRKTGFTTTLGVSVNPLLAKLASGLKKPATVNLLYPWHAPPLVASMPLRKIPGIGSCTIKSLHSCLAACHGNRQRGKSLCWTCRDLLQVPPGDIEQCLGKIPMYQKSRSEQTKLLLQNCRGIDLSQVVDDQGGLPKTVSVENSFRRGTIRTHQAVCQAMEDLFVRLPRLLVERKTWSHNPCCAYPNTIRLSLRLVREQASNTSRRAFENRSKQTGINGKMLLDQDNVEKQQRLLKRLVSPLLRSLVPYYDNIYVTTISIAVANFQDFQTTLEGERLRNSPPERKTFLERFAPDTAPEDQRSRQHAVGGKLGNSIQHQISRREFRTDATVQISQDDIDPTVLSELPTDVAAEVMRSYPKRRVKRQRIDQFFAKKSR